MFKIVLHNCLNTLNSFHYLTLFKTFIKVVILPEAFLVILSV